MKITIEQTTKFTEINGVPCRIWEGKTEGGVKITAFIPRVAVLRSDDCSEFDRELVEHPPMKTALDSWPARMVL